MSNEKKKEDKIELKLLNLELPEGVKSSNWVGMQIGTRAEETADLTVGGRLVIKASKSSFKDSENVRLSVDEKYVYVLYRDLPEFLRNLTHAMKQLAEAREEDERLSQIGRRGVEKAKQLVDEAFGKEITYNARF